MDDFVTVGVCCGKCGSDEIHMHPCEECEHVQFSTCFSCGETYHLPGHHHDRRCSRRPVSDEIVPLYDENHTSTRRPRIAPPVSAATAGP